MGSSPSAAASSPGVRLREDLAYEPMLHVGLDRGSLGGVYASADAARVGGGLYQALVEALCTLATDPSPRVAAAGLAALRSAAVELVPVPAAAAAAGLAGSRATLPAPSRTPLVTAGGSSGALPVGTPAASGGPGAFLAGSSGGVGSILPKSWQPKSWRTVGSKADAAATAAAAAPAGSPVASVGGLGNGRQLPPSQAQASVDSSASLAAEAKGRGSTAASPSPSPSSGSTYTRMPYVLRRAPDAGDAPLQHAHTRDAAAFDPSLSRAMSTQGSVASLDAPPSALLSAAAAALLPPSAIYAASCRAFTWPLLAPQSLEEPGPAHATWLLPPDGGKVDLRRQHRQAELMRCRTVGTATHCLRLRDHVLTVNTETEHNTAVLLDPLRPFMVTSDRQGVLRVSNYRSGTCINRFHAGTGASIGGASTAYSRALAAAAGAAPPMAVRSVFQLNELHNGLLMACAADGSVRVWRNYAVRGQQRLATAWQAVLVAAAGSPTRPAVYHWSPTYSALFAAGGRSSERIYMWDLERENCIAQLNLPGGGGGGGTNGEGPPAVEHIAASCCSPLLYAADSAGAVRIFDLRSSELAGSVQHIRSRLAGLVVEPGGTPHQLVLGYPAAQLAFLDCRMISSSSSGAATTSGSQPAGRLEVGVWKTVEAHSKGQVTALAAHPNAPLLATATNNQVVKVWSSSGEQVGVVRAHSSFLATHRIGAITCLTFAPYELLLASGSADPVVAVYGLDVAAGSLPPSPARPPFHAAPPPLVAPHYATAAVPV